MDSFDPYQQWFGIPAKLRPVNHYVLLGVRVFEEDPAKIADAAESRLQSLQPYRSGPRREIAEQLMTEVSRAKVDLVDASKKSRYDHELRLSWETIEAHQQIDEPSTSNQVGESQADAAEDASQDFAFVANFDGEPSKTKSAPSKTISPSLREPEDESWLGMLMDIRVIASLLSFTVLIMTATVWVLSDRTDPAANAAEATAKQTESVSTQSETEPGVQSDSKDPGEGLLADDLSQLRAIQQKRDGSFLLSPEKGKPFRAEMACTAKGIRGWETGDEVRWRLKIAERRGGYFYCQVSYLAKSEGRFSVQLGRLGARTFTLYPHQSEFTEEFIVRLDKLDEQAFTLAAKQVDSIAEVQIKRVVLVPK